MWDFFQLCFVLFCFLPMVIYLIRFRVGKKSGSREVKRFISGHIAKNGDLLASKTVLFSMHFSVFLLQLPSSWVGGVSP